MIFNIFTKKFKTLSALALSAVLLTGLSACESTSLSVKESQLNRIAFPVFMLKRHIPVDDISIVAFERVHDPLQVTQIYIEDYSRAGDRGLYSPKNPATPVALRLAAQDGQANVIYLSAPCQYMSSRFMSQGPADACSADYYKEGPVSAAIVGAYGQAIDNIRRYHGVDSFVLNGYGSGASVAAILASQRLDVEGLRTVAGHLDMTHYEDKKLNWSYEGGLNPLDSAKSLTHLPQYHFIGQEDAAESVKIYHNFAQAVGPTWCLRHSLIPNADKRDGWVEQWKSLQALPLNCRADRQNAGMAPVVDLTPVPFNPATLDIMDDMHGPGKK
jgi:pimeloyl-ACP methyl ester carboxylesterase